MRDPRAARRGRGRSAATAQAAAARAAAAAASLGGEAVAPPPLPLPARSRSGRLLHRNGRRGLRHARSRLPLRGSHHLATRASTAARTVVGVHRYDGRVPARGPREEQRLSSACASRRRWWRRRRRESAARPARRLLLLRRRLRAIAACDRRWRGRITYRVRLGLGGGFIAALACAGSLVREAAAAPPAGVGGDDRVDEARVRSPPPLRFRTSSGWPPSCSRKATRSSITQASVVWTAEWPAPGASRMHVTNPPLTTQKTSKGYLQRRSLRFPFF